MTASIKKFLRYQTEQGGILPPTQAALFIGVTRAALFRAKKEKRVTGCKLGGVTYYGFSALENYKKLRDEWKTACKNRRKLVNRLHRSKE